MKSCVLRSLGLYMVLAALVMIPMVVSAQVAAAAKGSSADSQYASRWDIFAGYSYLAPQGTVQIPTSSGTPIPVSYKAVNVGGLFSGAYYFNRFLGVQAEFAEHKFGTWTSNTSGSIGTLGNNDGFYTLAGGLIARHRSGNITPFVHALVNLNQVEGPAHNLPKWGPGATAGGGLDYELPWLNHHMAFRLFQADYEYMHANFGPQINPPGGRASINAARLSTGVVFHAGSIAPPVPVTLGCTVSPNSVFPGETVTLTAAGGNILPKENAIYSWSGQGVTGNGATATVATANLAPGTYTATANLKAGKAGKEGLKPWQSASCTASFTVKAFEPPTISCSVSPTTMQPGGVATVTARGVSPQNRPLTYSYATSAGSISGSGTTAQYSSAGAPTGAVGITCNVADDKGHTATASTGLNIVAPPPPPQPHTQALCSIGFGNDIKRPTRVDNEAKACLDQVALSLKQQSTAKAVIIADSNAKEKDTEAKEQKKALRNKRVVVENFAGQRAVNAKEYLVTEQGIDPSRITLMTGAGDDQTAKNYLVPAGANFAKDVQAGTPVDETTVKPEVRKALPLRHR